MSTKKLSKEKLFPLSFCDYMLNCILNYYLYR